MPIKCASVVSVGNEVLSGQTIDSNAAHIGRELLLLGLPVASSYTVGDDCDCIVRAMKLACQDADVVITTGGLGPTADDLTRQAFGQLLGRPLELQPALLAEIESFFARRGVSMAETNKIQAFLPAGSTAVPNPWGTAPGIQAQKDGALLFALPGVPSEMQRMLSESVIPQLRAVVSGQAVAVRKLRCFGAGESTIAGQLGEKMNRDRNPLVNSTASAGVITLSIVATADTAKTARRMADDEAASIRVVLGDVVFGQADQTLAAVVAEMLRRRGETIALAESCTGGLVAKLLTDVPGSSDCFRYGWVTYSNDAKITELSVASELIAEHGAVSEEVAQAMAQGARARAKADFAIGITGIAGPAGAAEEKPVGLTYICVDEKDGAITRRCIFSRGRTSIRLRASLTALDMVRQRMGD